MTYTRGELDSAPTQKDVVVAIIGAASALAGLVLVFLGVVLAAYQGFPGDTPDQVKAKYRISGSWTVIVFALSLVTVAFSFLWLIAGGGTVLFLFVTASFVIQLVALMAVATRVSQALLDGYRWR
jgi:hypothetical protein